MKILIADDEPNIVTALEFLLRRAGYEVCSEIRRGARGRRIRIVMLSAKGGQADIDKGLQAGADLYVTKPFANGELLGKIKDLLSR